MKLLNELPGVVARLKGFIAKNGEKSVRDYMKAVKDSGEYKNYDVRIANDIVKYGCIGSRTVCEWYRQYGCHDSHVTTLCIAAMKQVGLLPYQEQVTAKVAA